MATELQILFMDAGKAIIACGRSEVNRYWIVEVVVFYELNVKLVDDLIVEWPYGQPIFLINVHIFLLQFYHF